MTAQGGLQRGELERAAAMADQLHLAGRSLLQATAELRRHFDPDLARQALTQSELRRRAVDKFGTQAATMLFTSDGVQQATRSEVAQHRARRFAATGRSSVLDLCCGIGADALAFAAAGLTVTAIERDQVTADFAASNLASTTASVLVGNAEDAPWRSAEMVFVDPARRTDRGRTFDPTAYSPSFDFVTEVLTTCQFAAAKLGPGIAHDLVPAHCEAEWVSFDGDVKEAVLYSAGFAHDRPADTGPAGDSRVRHRATVLPAGASLTVTDPHCEDIGDIGDFVYEPDGAVIRAGLVQHAAALLTGGRRLDEHLAYLTSDQLSATPFCTAFGVLDVLPYSVDRLRAELRSRDVGIVEIKKRGVDVDPAQLRRQLKPKGNASLTVLLARVGDRRLAILADRIPR